MQIEPAENTEPEAQIQTGPAEGAEPAGEAETSDETEPAPGVVGGAGQETAPAEGAESGRDGLDPDLIYAVLVAELAGRGGDMATAFSHYLHAAQLARDAGMAELAVRAAVAGKDDEGAQRAIALWISIEPDSVSAHQVAALLRLQAGDREGALTHLSRVVALSGADAGAGYSHAVGIIGRAGTVEERLALMRDLVDLDAQNPEAHHALAVVAAAAGRPPQRGGRGPPGARAQARLGQAPALAGPSDDLSRSA